MENRRHLPDMKTKIEDTSGEFKKFSYPQIIEGFFRIAGTSALVVSASLPLQILIDKKRLSMGKESNINFAAFARQAAFASFFRQHWAWLGSLFKNNYLSSFLRSVAVTHRDEVQQQTSEVLGQTNKDHVPVPLIGATAAIVSGLETGLTQYLSNRRIAITSGYKTEIIFPTLRAKLQFAKQALGVRYTGTFVSNFCFLYSNNDMKEHFTNLIKPEYFGWFASPLTSLCATITGATISGTLTNVFYVAHTKMVEGALKSKSIQAPSLFNILKMLIKEQGTKSLMNGTGYGIAQTAVVYFALNTAESFEDCWDSAKQNFNNKARGLFSFFQMPTFNTEYSLSCAKTNIPSWARIPRP